MRRLLLPILLCALLLPGAASAQAEAPYPSRPIRMVVPFAAGGAADLVARITAQGMQEEMGQAVVVENRGGSGGVIGTEAALAAAPDGYTIIFHSMSSAVLNAGLYRNLSFDIRQAFAPIALVGTVPNIVVVNPRVPANTLQELIALLRREPGRHSYASSGAGTIVHLSSHLLTSMAGVEMVHVPYRGSGPAMNDLIAGTVDMMVDTLPTVIPFVRSGQLRALAMSTRSRAAVLPDVPTAEEAGLPGYETYNWHAVFAPAAVPAAIRERLERGTVAAIRAPATMRRLADVGVEPRGTGAAELAEFWDAQLALWIPIIRASGATAD
jgi:tripartite-type tricarboxylate transporter receptor subunit TctC